MIKKNLIRFALTATIIATLAATAGCGKKKNTNVTVNTETQATVSSETNSLANKELTKTGIVSFDYTDADGNTVKLEGKAVANEKGEATIEVTDSEGNKAVFTGKATTVDGKLSVSDISVKDGGTLKKSDGTEIKVSAGTTVADASETDGSTDSDISVSDDIKQEVDTAKQEEQKIEEAREEVKKTESNEVADNKPAEPDPTPSEPEKEPETEAPAPPVEPDPTPAPTPAPVEPDTPAPTEPETEPQKTIDICEPLKIVLSNGVSGEEGTVGQWLFTRYLNNELSIEEVKSLVLNGQLCDFYVKYEDGSVGTIENRKPTAVEFAVAHTRQELLDLEGPKGLSTPGRAFTEYSNVGEVENGAIYFIIIYYNL